jgi:hypothetical protein
MTVTKRKNPHKNKQQQQQQEPANPLVYRASIANPPPVYVHGRCFFVF